MGRGRKIGNPRYIYICKYIFIYFSSFFTPKLKEFMIYSKYRNSAPKKYLWYSVQTNIIISTVEYQWKSVVRHAWDKFRDNKLCLDNELGEIITFHSFIILMPCLIHGKSVLWKKNYFLMYLILAFVLSRVGQFVAH